MTTKCTTLPPSGSKKPPTGHTPQLATSGKQLGNAQLLFEPSPKLEKTNRNRSPSPNIRRRTQSAKTSHTKSSRSLLVSSFGNAERRPVSAVVPGEKQYLRTSKSKEEGVHFVNNANNRPSHVPVPTQFLAFEETDSCPHHSSLTEPPHRHVPRTYHGKVDFKGHGHEDTAGHHESVPGKNSRRMFSDDGLASEENRNSLPQGISALSPWITPGLPSEWIGVDEGSCVVFLPSLLGETEALPVVPPPQESSEVMPHKPPPPQPKPFDPRKLFHYDVEKNLPSYMKDVDGPRPKSRPGTSKDGRIYSLNGQLLHDQCKYSRNRTALMIKQEIEDLELLLEGVGRKGSANPVVQYQYEISMLKKAVSDTIIQCHLMRRPKPKEEEPPDLTGLRQYIREREHVLAKIKARREACLIELAKLENSLGLGDQANQSVD
ncbi:uncharacterized protein LOC121422705 [Lytechinus variegatus]|uniref:uncharacterized protein LOC121422705 n=1 Tax=Lytechinus variegatus TaxID=7654 RepID=UPI001BB0FE38|nr:uncharacterized protein LOC121422705 [Lytechinus variegatus]